MIAFRDFALRRGERLLLSKVDLTLQAGWRVGVIGRNGTGKSSLFAAIQGELESDLGNLDIPNRVRMASVAQETPALDDPALDFVLSGDAKVHAAIMAERMAVEAEDWEAVAECHHRLEELNGYDASARARFRRTRQPPENSLTARSCVSAVKPRPCSSLPARALAS